MASDTEIQAFHETDPAAIGSGYSGAAYTCESMGVFTAKEKAEVHSEQGAMVIMSAPRIYVVA